MIIIVGLGNPGEKFNFTRHNIGFEALDFFAKGNNFPDFAFSKKYNAEISEGNNMLLVKPLTFMNDSGSAVKEILRNKSEPVLIVVHDDVDLPLGKIKFVKDSSAGGHKGVDSIIQHLGTKDFIRLKIGVGSEGPASAQGSGVAKEKVPAIEIVLKKFSPQEKETVIDVIEKSAEALDYFIENGLEKTMNAFN